MTTIFRDTKRTARQIAKPHTGLVPLCARFIVTLLLMVVAVSGMWGQTDYSGFYYFANDNSNNYVGYSDISNYYMRPAEIYYADGSITEDNNGKPLLTTFQTMRDNTSLWEVKKVDGTNYYLIIHVNTGKYLTVHDKLTAYDGHRMRVHLEDLTTPTDRNYFTIEDLNLDKNGTHGYTIGCIEKYKSGNNQYLNPSGGNQSSLKPTTANSNTGGIVGFYTKGSGSNRGSVWYFEQLTCEVPEIRFDSNSGQISITTATEGATIYYTMAASNPADPTIDTETSGPSPLTLSGITTGTVVKAIAAKTGYLPSLVATLSITKVATPVFDVSSGNSVAISCATIGTTIYYTTDGSEPTTASSIYSRPLTDVLGKTIKAMAVKTNCINSDVVSTDGPVSFSCATPVIKRGTGNTFTIECIYPSEGVTIHYTTDGSVPTAASAVYTEPVEITAYPVTIKAIATAEGCTNSAVAEKNLTENLTPSAGVYEIASAGDFSLFVSMANTDEGAAASYRVTSDFTVGTTSPITKTFTGTFDGGYFTISGLDHALFNSVNGATVKNVVLSGVGISGGTNAGAICNGASGNAKIYNCGVLSGSVSGSANVGGLVGQIVEGSSVRVVNCYNYATVSGGSTMAGIVGMNDGTVGDVRIALCMMYGDMPGGTSPVYAGNHISNASNFTEYNYWRSRANISYSVYNDQLAIDKDEYLTRFPFYRHILNSHHELAAYFLFGASDQNVGDMTDDQKDEIGHWALKKDVAPYPIIEQWAKDTKKVLQAPAGTLVSDENLGTSLSVKVIIGGSTYSATLPITDMDEANFDYTWGKVVLPFANEFEVNTDYTKVCTGWKITSITGGTTGTFSNYNVSDRDCTVKDLYDTTGFIFAQGGNFVVPYGVTEIEITANFATAYYLSDESYEIAYSGDRAGNNNSGYTDRKKLGGDAPNSYHGQTVYHTLAAALTVMTASGSTHEQAVVLVGNYHQDSEILSDHLTKGLTIMSIDADNNQEPDYAWYSNNTQDRPAIPPTRFDFVALIPMGMSSRVNNSTFYPVIPIWKTRGWYEQTETSLSTMEQFELDSNLFNTSSTDTRNYRCIINGGYFTQMVRSRGGSCNKVKYFQIGGNAYIKEFYPGSHSARSQVTSLVPINVTGGEIEQCFMTGYGKGTASGNNIYFWCAGGNIGKFLGAYMENPNTSGVNMTAKIDHAKIGRFFGGGTSPNAQITGDIDVTINNSHVDFYCGGPEFGDMSSGKTVTTHATGTTFGEYYGAGFGGTAITYSNDEDNNEQGLGSDSKPTVTYPSSFFNSHFVGERLKYVAAKGGIGSCYKFEFIFNSRGHQSVARFYTGYAKFSLATTGSVTNVLNDCVINNDFYGAGCQGKVDGTVTSTLTGCTVNGSAYGGGFKAESNEVDVYPKTEPEMSVYTRETGIFSDFGKVAPETYTWVQGTAENNNKAVESEKKLYTGTDITMSELGNVTGAITLNIESGTTVGGSVFGGGNESRSRNNATVNFKGGTVVEDVYGGGNKANVDGNTTVNLTGGTVNNNVYGGARGTEVIAAQVGGNTEVNLNGTQTVETVEGQEVTSYKDDCVVKGSIFGCNNLNGTPLGNVKVHIFKTEGYDGHWRTGKAATSEEAREAMLDDIDDAKHSYEVAAVYGGGNLAAYEPTDPDTKKAWVIVDGCELTSIRQVYGGGNAASTPATQVDINGTYEIEEVFGGGNGKDDISLDGGTTWRENPGANVGYKNYSTYNAETGSWVDNDDAKTKEQRQAPGSAYLYGTGEATVNIHGGRVHRVYGGSNTKGNVRQAALTMLEDEELCAFKVDEAYGGGKSAPMDGAAQLEMACIPGLKAAYGGAEAATIQNDVTLNITNGNFDRVFGGNNISGTIEGTITVNIEETKCRPIIIGQLYGGGNQAAYSAPFVSGSTTERRPGPTLNVRSFTSIGEIYGGGYGKTAVVTGDTHVNINVCMGDKNGDDEAQLDDTQRAISFSEFLRTDDGGFQLDDSGNRISEPRTVTVLQPSHNKGAIGAIGTVFGGGNAADVDGDTYVLIGTKATETFHTASSLTDHDTVRGADIRGNVYGGGNQATVTGSTNVYVGKEKVE